MVAMAQSPLLKGGKPLHPGKGEVNWYGKEIRAISDAKTS